MTLWAFPVSLTLAQIGPASAQNSNPAEKKSRSQIDRHVTDIVSLQHRHFTPQRPIERDAALGLRRPSVVLQQPAEPCAAHGLGLTQTAG